VKSILYLFTYCREQGSYWETKRFSASQKIPHILWNRKVHYRIHQHPLPVPILRQIDPVYAHTSHFLKIRLNIILPSAPGSSKWSLSLRFLHQNPVYTSALPYMCYMPRPSHPSRIAFFINFIFSDIFLLHTFYADTQCIQCMQIHSVYSVCRYTVYAVLTDTHTKLYVYLFILHAVYWISSITYTLFCCFVDDLLDFQPVCIYLSC